MTRMQRVMTNGDNWFSWVSSRVRSSREISTKHSVLPICHIWYTKSPHTLYIPKLPTFWEECFHRENPSHYPWKMRDFYTYNSLHNLLWFSSTFTSPFPNLWEVDGPNTYHTHSECQVRFWCCWEVLEEAKFWQMQLGILRDPKS